MFRTPNLLILLAVTVLASHPALVFASKPARAVTAPAQAVLEKSGVRLQLIQPDIATLQREDRQRDVKDGVPLRYGKVVPVGKLLAQSQAGIWSMQADGRWLWQLQVSAKGASSLEFAFSRFHLPHGSTLRIQAADGSRALEPLTDADNPLNGGLYTPMLVADSATLELIVPADKRDMLELSLDRVVWGYRDPWQAARSKSGSCNIDTACPEAAGWSEQAASVAGYGFSNAGDQLWCSGNLMNTGDDAEDAAHPRFSTAYHCVSTQQEADTLVFYWGYESLTCRTPGSSESGTMLPIRPNTRAVQLGGATVVATNEATDFTALELNRPVPAEAEAYYSGWDRSGTTPPGSVGIHHPRGHEKRITFDDDPLTPMHNCITGGTDPTTHWRAGPYDLGTTEGGSSGSGLWNVANGLLVGVLSGGDASCGNPTGYDCYGRLSAAWEAESLTGETIRSAFDRGGNNPATMPGKGACDAPQVSLDSSAFTTAPRAGTNFQIRASATGGAGGYRYLWDLDDDGVIEREGNSRVTVSYPTGRSVNVRVSVRDAEGCIGSTSKALDIVAPVIEVAELGELRPICGNSDGTIDPGERYELPVTLHNTGDAPLAGGAQALFAPVRSVSGNGISNLYGYEGGDQCGYDFIDIATGAHAVAPLQTYVANDNTYGPRDDARSSEISLGGAGFTLYGVNYDKAVMSTNGYVSFDPDESGGNWSVSCDGALDFGAKGPQLRPYHDDLVVRPDAGAGLRYRWFASCPRSAASGVAQGCHVFQWTGVGYYIDEDEIDSNFEFQAVAYGDTGEVAYQYKSAASDEGDLANVGLIGVEGADPLNLACESMTQPVKARTAMCIHSPQALAAAPVTLRLAHPTQKLPSISAGGQTTVMLSLAISPDAACSTPLTIDYVATAGARNHSVQGSRHQIGRIADTCRVVTSCPLTVAPIDIRDGNYYNPERSGNGFNHYSLGGMWYTAEADHTPTWYGFSGTTVDNLMSGSLTRAKNIAPAPDIEIGTPPPGMPVPREIDIVRERAGFMQVARVDVDQLMLFWALDDGRKGAELLRPVALGLPRASPNYTQHWYPPSESGWGLDVQSLILDQRRYDGVLMYFYDRTGQSRWVLSDGYADNGKLTMKAYRPHCPGCPHFFDWNSDIKDAGSVNVQWSDSGNATIQTGINLPAPLEGKWHRFNVPLIPIGEIQP